MIPLIAFEVWRKVLQETFGRGALLSIDPSLTQKELDLIADHAANPDDSQGKRESLSRHSQLWVMDLTGAPLILARQVGWRFFAVVMDKTAHLQPVMVEEPDPDNPCSPRPGVVGRIQAMVAVSLSGQVYVKTVETVCRVATTDLESSILELDRSSLSRGVQLSGTPVGPISHTNTARLRGGVQCLYVRAREEAPLTEDGWMKVEDFFQESPDLLGKAALITALVGAKLVKFG